MPRVFPDELFPLRAAADGDDQLLVELPAESTFESYCISRGGDLTLCKTSCVCVYLCVIVCVCDVLQSGAQSGYHAYAFYEETRQFLNEFIFKCVFASLVSVSCAHTLNGCRAGYFFFFYCEC